MSLSAASERNFPVWSSSLEYVDRAAGYVHELLMHFSSIKWAKEVWILLCFQYVQWSLFCFLSLILWENLHVYMYMNHYYFWLQHRSWIFDEAVIYLKTIIIIIFFFFFCPFYFCFLSEEFILAISWTWNLYGSKWAFWNPVLEIGQTGNHRIWNWLNKQKFWFSDWAEMKFLIWNLVW